MNKLFTLFFISFSFFVNAQNAEDYAVVLSAQIQENPPQITLNWRTDSLATSIAVFRKLKSSNSWGGALTTLGGTSNQFVDNNVAIEISYEYRLVKTRNTFTGYGYINSGITLPLVEDRGTMIQIVDDSIAQEIATELDRYDEDLVGDGWNTIRYDVSRTSSVSSIRTLIQSEYNASPNEVKAVTLIGHVPVPYSGDNAPDGHVNDHKGAWPADVYYGEMNGNWQDATVNNTSASSSRNHNVPGDGKFDHTQIPSNVELQVGRIDMFNMPAFSETEVELLKKYFDKNHAYRHKQFEVVNRGAIDDNFGAFGGEAFAANGWRNFGGMFGTESSDIISTDFFNNMSQNSYKWSYGCGAGSFTSAGGIGSTTDFVNDSLQCVFMMLFGSYFGDWDSQNNFLRAPLASGLTLANCWAGRPNWYFHHMSMGENIGYGTRLSQNNSSTYVSGFGFRYCHANLMGDPSLRQHIVAPAQNLQITDEGEFAQLTWTASTDSALAGYKVYRLNGTTGSFFPLHDNPISTTIFNDSCLLAGNFEYQVKAIKLEIGASGSYFNSSQGVFGDITMAGFVEASANFQHNGPANPVSFTNLSANSTYQTWFFGDSVMSNLENPTHQYSIPGNYEVILVANNACSSDTFSQNVNVLSSGLENHLSLNSISVHYLGKGVVQISELPPLRQFLLKVFDCSGRETKFESTVSPTKITLRLKSYVPGIYHMLLQEGEHKWVGRKLLIK